MKQVKVFVEARPFAARLKTRLTDEAYRALQNMLLANPDAGVVMPRCGGPRKVRFAEEARGKGKRGGTRVVYLHIAEIGRMYLITIYSKGEKANLSATEQKQLAALAKLIREEALAGQPKEK